VDRLAKALIEYLEHQPPTWKQVVPVTKELGLSRKSLKKIGIETRSSSVVLTRDQTILLLKTNKKFRKFFVELMVKYALEIFSRSR